MSLTAHTYRSVRSRAGASTVLKFPLSIYGTRRVKLVALKEGHGDVYIIQVILCMRQDLMTVGALFGCPCGTP